MLVVVTGAGGFVGGEVCRAFHARGARVRAAVRRPSPASDALRALGLEVVAADLSQPDSIRSAFAAAEVVVHAAARVGDHGPAREYRRANVFGMRNALDAAAATGVRRFLHISSVDVYGHLRARGGEYVDEDDPLPLRIPGDAYAQTKLQAEQELWSHAGRFEKLALRPGWVYGPGDRVSLPRLARQARAGRAPLFDRGAHNLNLVHVRDLAAAVCGLACEAPLPGSAFNAVGELANARDFLTCLARSLGAPDPHAMLPTGASYAVGRLFEALWKLPLPGEPLVTRHAVRLLAPQPIYRSERLCRVLGAWPRENYRDGLPEAVRWLTRQSSLAAS